MDIEKSLLEKNSYSRPGTSIGSIKKLVVHWVGNAGSTAIANRNYFNSLKSGKRNKSGTLIYASAHYIVGLKGEVIACVPENEIAYHAGKANTYAIGIEVCHPDWEGSFNNVTKRSLIELLYDLCRRYKLNPKEDIIRHYDVTGKLCPLYYVKHVDKWEALKEEVEGYAIKQRKLLIKKEKSKAACEEKQKPKNL